MAYPLLAPAPRASKLGGRPRRGDCPKARARHLLAASLLIEQRLSYKAVARQFRKSISTITYWRQCALAYECDEAYKLRAILELRSGDPESEHPE